MSGAHRLWRIGNRRLARHNRRTTQEEAEQSIRLSDGPGRNQPSDEGGPGRADSWEAGPENMGVHHRSYIRFHPGVRCSVGL